jgi:hypothetical protein
MTTRLSLMGCLFLAMDSFACSCPAISEAVDAGEVAAWLAKQQVTVIRARVIDVHTSPSDAGKLEIALEVKETYFGKSGVGSITTPSSGAACGIAVSLNEERDFLLTRNSEARLCNDALLRSVPGLIEEVRKLKNAK